MFSLSPIYDYEYIIRDDNKLKCIDVANFPLRELASLTRSISDDNRYYTMPEGRTDRASAECFLAGYAACLMRILDCYEKDSPLLDFKDTENNIKRALNIMIDTKINFENKSFIHNMELIKSTCKNILNPIDTNEC